RLSVSPEVSATESLMRWSLNVVPLSLPRSITVTAPDFSIFSIACRWLTLGSVSLTVAPEPEPRITLSRSDDDSLTAPSGPVMRKVMAFFFDMALASEVVDRLLQLGVEVVANLDQALERRLLLADGVAAFRLGELAFDGHVGEIDDRLLAVD